MYENGDTEFLGDAMFIIGIFLLLVCFIFFIAIGPKMQKD